MSRNFVCTKDFPVVETKAGKLRGFCLDGIYTFHGIKYADAERFQAPRPVEPWEGIKNATNYGYIAPAGSNPVPTSEIFIPHRFWPENEHCQYLNIWTQSIDSTSKRPVMVWLHGGGYFSGSSMEQVSYEGDKLAEYGDVVVVTLNHRLNILGFLDMSPYGEKYANSVNAGMADIVAALQWIHENILGFGGDPENVTIFGQSGGGGKVQTLLNTPAAEGLFHKAILMSGVMSNDDRVPVDHKPLIEGMLKELNIPVNEAEKLEEVPTDILYRVYSRVAARLERDGITIKWQPAANDWYLGNPLYVGFSDYAKKVPTMAGSVIAEFTGHRSSNDGFKDEADVLEAIRKTFGASAEKIIELFRKAYHDKPIQDLLHVDRVFRPITTRFIARKAEESEAPAYLYQFALDFDVMGGSPAWHCSDIPFVFHNCERVGNCNIEGVTERLEGQVSGAWVSFAYSGNPNHPGMPKWEAFGGTKATMVFDRKSECCYDIDSELIAAIEAEISPLSVDDVIKIKDGSKNAQKEEKSWIY